LRPDAAARARLHALAESLQRKQRGARRLAAADLHLTLAFIGALPADRAAQVARHLAAMPARPFDWKIDHVAAFARARVAWAGGPVDERLEDLASRVRAQLDGLEVSYDRQRFAAHVTLLRGAAASPREELPRAIPWRATHPVLMLSRHGHAGALRYQQWQDGPSLPAAGD
jgi:2'-5' RNA ligase